MFYAVANFLIRVAMRLLTQMDIYGVEHVPATGSLLIVANHVHFADPPILAAALPRKVTFMAKSELFRTPVLGWIVWAYEAFAVRRGEGDTRAIRQALTILKEGRALGLFPEGHRSRTGELQRARVGAAMLAFRAGATILPVGISGTRAFLSWRMLIHRPRVVVNIGKPFKIESPGRANRSRQQELTDTIMRQIAALLPPEQRGAYQELPDGDLPESPPLETAASGKSPSTAE